MILARCAVLGPATAVFRFIHGFSQIDPETCSLLRAIRTILPEAKIHAPSYHPNQSLVLTRIDHALETCRTIINNSPTKKLNVIGFSFGGLLAALFAARYPELVNKVLLFAPAIDNFERNYADKPRDSWTMPPTFVEALQTYPARPPVTRPTTIVHGSLDNDEGGGSFWRIERWAQEQSFEEIYLLDGVDHSLEPWLSQHTRNTPTPKEQPLTVWPITLRELLMRY